jgi:hypothetical protein
VETKGASWLFGEITRAEAGGFGGEEHPITPAKNDSTAKNRRPYFIF